MLMHSHIVLPQRSLCYLLQVANQTKRAKKEGGGLAHLTTIPDAQQQAPKHAAALKGILDSVVSEIDLPLGNGDTTYSLKRNMSLGALYGNVMLKVLDVMSTKGLSFKAVADGTRYFIQNPDAETLQHLATKNLNTGHVVSLPAIRIYGDAKVHDAIIGSQCLQFAFVALYAPNLPMANGLSPASSISAWTQQLYDTKDSHASEVADARDAHAHAPAVDGRGAVGATSSKHEGGVKKEVSGSMTVKELAEITIGHIMGNIPAGVDPTSAQTALLRWKACKDNVKKWQALLDGKGDLAKFVSSCMSRLS
jgi:hypothetical protein